MRSSISAALCLVAWNVAMGRSNCTRALAYSTARSKLCCIEPSSSAHSATAPSSTTRRQIGGVVTGRSDRLGGHAVELEAGHPTRHVERRVQLTARVLDHEGPQSLLGAGRDRP